MTMISAFKEIQLYNACGSLNIGIETPKEIDAGGHGAASRKQIINDYDFLAWSCGICLDFNGVVLKI
jgi:hypothetical protein